MFGRAEQSREACIAVETWPAQPIDGTVATDEGGSYAIADQCIVLDLQRKIGSYGRLLATTRPRANAWMRLFQVRLDLWDDGRSLLGYQGIDLTHNLRNDVRHQPINVDADRI
jgi:hypothetical protein